MSDRLYRRAAGGMEAFYPRTLAANVLTEGGRTVEAVLLETASLATPTANGLMSAEDKQKLDGLQGTSSPLTDLELEAMLL